MTDDQTQGGGENSTASRDAPQPNNAPSQKFTFESFIRMLQGALGAIVFFLVTDTWTFMREQTFGALTERAEVAERAVTRMEKIERELAGRLPIRARYGPVVGHFQEVDFEKTNSAQRKVGDCSGGKEHMCLRLDLALVDLPSGDEALAVGFTEVAPNLNTYSRLDQTRALAIETGCLIGITVPGIRISVGIEFQDREKLIVGIGSRTMTPDEFKQFEEGEDESLRRYECPEHTDQLTMEIRRDLDCRWEQGWRQHIGAKEIECPKPQ